MAHLEETQTKPNTSHQDDSSSHGESTESMVEIPEITVPTGKPKSIRVPLLSLDINLGQGRTDKIIIF